ncbi:MAG: hypothetical protein PHW02_04790 [bacterium]|nr:hypothetical protein [bacterium]
MKEFLKKAIIFICILIFSFVSYSQETGTNSKKNDYSEILGKEVAFMHDKDGGNIIRAVYGFVTFSILVLLLSSPSDMDMEENSVIKNLFTKLIIPIGIVMLISLGYTNNTFTPYIKRSNRSEEYEKEFNRSVAQSYANDFIAGGSASAGIVTGFFLLWYFIGFVLVKPIQDASGCAFGRNVVF